MTSDEMVEFSACNPDSSVCRNTPRFYCEYCRFPAREERAECALGPILCSALTQSVLLVRSMKQSRMPSVGNVVAAISHRAPCGSQEDCAHSVRLLWRDSARLGYP